MSKGQRGFNLKQPLPNPLLKKERKLGSAYNILQYYINVCCNNLKALTFPSAALSLPGRDVQRTERVYFVSQIYSTP